MSSGFKHIILVLFCWTGPSALCADEDTTSWKLADIALDDNQFNRKRILKNPRKARPVGLNAHIWGVGGFGALSVDGFITPNIAAEAGMGVRNFEGQLSYFIGARYHILGKTALRLTPYAGIYTAANLDNQRLSMHSIYIPAGIHRIKKSGFNWALEIAFEQNSLKEEGMSGSFKLGYRF